MMKDIMLLFVGTAIGFLFSMLTVLVNEIITNWGKVKIYLKVVHNIVTEEPMGFWGSEDEMAFEIPVWIELQNTKRTVRIIRDFNLVLYNKGIEICAMKQINKINDIFMGNEGDYSFILEPKSIRKYTGYFCILKKELSEKNDFDEVKVKYYDMNDKEHICDFLKIELPWKSGEFLHSGKWQKI